MKINEETFFIFESVIIAKKTEVTHLKKKVTLVSHLDRTVNLSLKDKKKHDK